ncbi:acetate/propionate family kinase [Mycoplasmopsis felis]|uniref:Acetate kinase n=1 Tax=Mycoplasmopsis felis TaxID=33923 RepID=A0A809SK23_9BACT|nr:acetate/propionate family kinase [Mycoplasmopsis felis]BBU47486.1 acetate kinase [Mycoplasmopsis felis]
MNKILVINAGSSSIKFSLFFKDNLNLIASGIAERINLPGSSITINFSNSKKTLNIEMKNHKEAVESVYKLFEEVDLIQNKSEIENIGFRVVQGGQYFNKTTKLSSKEIELIDKCSIYAPLHNPGAIQAIKAFQKVFPSAKLSADFDTAFHTSIPKINYTYAIPKKLTEEYGIKKYGAHGISHQCITKKLSTILNKDKVSFVNLHLGNGASLCAIKDSKSIDTSMGLTPLAGIMMGTRSGDIDPSIHNFISKQGNISIEEFTNILNNQSGLLGVSGISSDMRDLTKAAEHGNSDAKFAIDLYCQKIADYTSIYANKIGYEIDALVFTAGIGENVSHIRANIISKLFFKKIKLDSNLNNQKIEDFALISTPDSEIKVYVIRTNEELVIARNSKLIYEE